MSEVTPKRGMRFIHKRLIRPGVTAAQIREDPENEDFYEIREVTRVAGSAVFHKALGAEKADLKFDLFRPEGSVRRWL